MSQMEFYPQPAVVQHDAADEDCICVACMEERNRRLSKQMFFEASHSPNRIEEASE